MTEKAIIERFNSFDGQSIKRSDLLSFYNAIKNDDLSPECVSIRLRVASALKKMNDGKTIYDLSLKSIPITKAIVHRPDSDIIFLCGLQNIQDDKDLDSKSLDGISDTTYQVVTDRITALIASDGLIWRKPWNVDVNGSDDLAHNGITKHTYRGGNFWLNFLCGAGGTEKYSEPAFYTFKQVTDAKGTVKKGSKAWPVVYFKWLYKSQAKNKLVSDREALDKNGKLKEGYTRIPGLFYYSVFNYDQCEGLPAIKKKASKPKTEKEKIESCEAIVEGMPKRPPITNVKGDSAHYQPGADKIVMPLMSQFKTEPEYYSTLFHELLHSTGHETRIGRTFGGKGTKAYAFEELIAEMGSCFLCAESGILYHTMKNSAAYVKSWQGHLLKEMKEDPKFFLSACSAAQKAADFILGEKKKAKTKETFKPKARGKKAAVKSDTHKTQKSKSAKKRKGTPVNGHSEVISDKPATLPAVVDGLGFTAADSKPGEPKKIFTLPGVIGELLGKLQAYKLAIIIGGETHSGKSELGKQIADAFISGGYSVGWVDWEQGGLTSRDTMESIERNILPANQSKLQVSGSLKKDLDAVKSIANKFDVVCLDSATSMRIHDNAWMEELRDQYPKTIWVLLFQLTDKGTVRGGSSAEFDAPVVLKTFRPDHKDYTKNYALVSKNRGNPQSVGLYYSTPGKKILGKDFDPEAIEYVAEEKEEITEPETTATIKL